MSCLRPKKGFPIGTTENGKTKYKITSYTADHVEYDGKAYHVVDDPHCRDGMLIYRTWIPIPCGKCLACKTKYARDWTCRLLKEKEKYKDEECWFLTLTYNDENLPMTYGANSLGELIEKPTLRPRDMQLFFKKVRKDYKIRVFYCGEYGSHSGRPHYHAIVFGLPLNDLKAIGTGKKGDVIYNSAYLDSKWKLGFLVIGNVTDASCAYVSRYCMKKAVKKPDPYVHPEFIRMSRRPGIGADAVADVRPIMQIGKNYYMPPRYYMKLLEQNDQKRAEELHDKIVEIAQNGSYNLSDRLGFDTMSSGRTAEKYLDYLGNKEYIMFRKVEIERSDL